MVNADYLDNSPPTYPPLSRRMGEQGTVLVRALISSSGVAIRVETIQTSGYGRLDRAALEAVSRWRFVAAHVDGVAVEAWVTIPVRFELDPL